MRAGEFAAGSALLIPREIRHDRRTARALADFRARLDEKTDAEVLLAAKALDGDERPIAAEFRAYVDAELGARGLSLAPLAGGTK